MAEGNLGNVCQVNRQNSQQKENCDQEPLVSQATRSSQLDSNPSQNVLNSQDEGLTSSLFHGVSEHASALASAIKHNTEEVTKLEAVYQSLEEQRITGWLACQNINALNNIISKSSQKREQDLVLSDCHRLMGEVCALDSEANKTKQNVKFQRGEIARLLWEKHLTKLEVVQKEREIERLKSFLDESGRKMDDAKQKVTEMEKKSDVEIELSRLQRQADELRSKKAELQQREQDMITLPSGVVMEEIDLLEDIRRLQQEISKKKALNEAKRKEAEECKQECEKMETANQILAKKNSAFLTRLKKKFEDEKEVYNAWKRRINFLQYQIELTQEKLQKLEK